MNKVYLLYKTQFQEEDFGICADAPSIIKGIFEDEPSAVLAKLELEKECEIFSAQFGDAEEEIKMVEIELNKIVSIKAW